MAEVLAPLHGRNRTKAWFAEGATSRTLFADNAEPYDNDWRQLKAREEMFASLTDVVAHLVFGLATTHIGGRVTLTRLEARADDADDLAVPRLVTNEAMRVDYLNTEIGMAVLTDESQSRVINIRLDAITQITATVGYHADDTVSP